MPPEARVLTAAELRPGLTAAFEREVTEEDILAFAANSGDHNPLHVDPGYAAGTPFGARIAHGAFQVGLASALIGMHLPGRTVLLGAISARFPAPLYFPARVRVSGEITAWNPESRGGTLKVTVAEAERLHTTAEVTMSFLLREEEARVTAPAPAAITGTPLSGARPRVLLTGAAGGLGVELARRLARDYTVLPVLHRSPLPPDLAGHPALAPVQADLAATDWPAALEEQLGPGPLYGIVHAAWPALPAGGLLDTPEEVLAQQLRFGAEHTIRLARLLFARAGEAGGRMVVLGTMAATHRPTLAMAAYSLGKAAQEHAVRLLAPELARRRVTLNLVSPAFVPVGLNRRAEERQLRIARAAVPLGRLCEPGDVAAAVSYLLSPEAAFVTGQNLGLYGGQL